MMHLRQGHFPELLVGVHVLRMALFDAAGRSTRTSFACAMTACPVCADKRGACADLSAPGPDDIYRVCTPFPFEVNLTLAAAQRDMELHIINTNP